MESETGQHARRLALGRERVQKPEEQTEEQRQRTRQYNYYYNNFIHIIVNKKQYILRFYITCILYTSGTRHDAHAYS